MPTARRSAARPLAAVIASALMLGACVSPVAGSDGRYAVPIGTAPVVSNETPYSASLRCLAGYALSQGRPLRIAVGQIADYTGKEEYEGGRRVTQGAALMAMSALSKTGVSLVERFDTSVAELELKYANNRLIGEGGGDPNFRAIMAGQFPGSDYYLVGGITELNYNIRSVGADAFGSDPATTGAKGQIGYQAYVMNVAIDLRLVNTQTLEVVDVISYQKQIIGREISAGVFDFLNGTIIDIGVGERALEPIQLAVRSVIERGVLEMIGRQLGVDSSACGGKDPLASEGEVKRPAPVRKAIAQRRDEETSRAKPYAGYSGSDPVAEVGLRRSTED
ncbi:MAG: holdfast anchoring protein HfaB [Alphaproteobacteria bacterium]|nr:holdfast anchoring protein HfaB [Alphaproteobacteria bacterium]